MSDVILPGGRPYSLSLKEGWRCFVEDPPRPQPRLLTKQEIAALDPRERLRYEDERAVWHANLGPIATPQMTAAHEDLWQIVESNRQDGDKVKSAAVIDAYPGLERDPNHPCRGRSSRHHARRTRLPHRLRASPFPHGG